MAFSHEKTIHFPFILIPVAAVWRFTRDSSPPRHALASPERGKRVVQLSIRDAVGGNNHPLKVEQFCVPPPGFLGITTLKLKDLGCNSISGLGAGRGIWPCFSSALWEMQSGTMCPGALPLLAIRDRDIWESAPGLSRTERRVAC